MYGAHYIRYVETPEAASGRTDICHHSRPALPHTIKVGEPLRTAVSVPSAPQRRPKSRESIEVRESKRVVLGDIPKKEVVRCSVDSCPGNLPPP